MSKGECKSLVVRVHRCGNRELALTSTSIHAQQGEVLIPSPTVEVNATLHMNPLDFHTNLK